MSLVRFPTEGEADELGLALIGARGLRVETEARLFFELGGQHVQRFVPLHQEIAMRHRIDVRELLQFHMAIGIHRAPEKIHLLCAGPGGRLFRVVLRCRGIRAQHATGQIAELQFTEDLEHLVLVWRI